MAEDEQLSIIWRDEEIKKLRARIRALEAEVAAQREARGVRVKALVWEAFGTMAFVAQAPLFGRLRVEQFGRGNTWTVCFSVPGYCDTFLAGEWADAETAKAAAQADYERRILATLEPAPVTVRDRLWFVAAVAQNGNRVGYRMRRVEADSKAEAIGLALAAFEENEPEWQFSKADALRALADAGKAG